MQKRFLTINSVIRKYQIETTRTEHLMADETEWHDAASVRDFSEAVRHGLPGARVTWALSWQALTDTTPRYVGIRDMVRTLHQQYGDDVTFIPGGYFANVYNTREQVNLDIAEALDLIEHFMGGYRPASLVAGFLSSDNIRYARERLGITTVQGNVWSQYSIDAQDGDGSLAYPYYPSTQHFCKPAQNGDRIDCLSLDGWTVDLVAARLVGDYWKDGERFVSRMGVGPLETLHTFGARKGLRLMQDTTQAHFGDENVRRNPFAWVTNGYEISEMNKGRAHDPATLEAFTEWLAWIGLTWPDAECPTIAEFGSLVRREHPDNESLRYVLRQCGSGVGASFAGQEVTWYMNRRFRLGLLRQDGGEPCVFDYTDYSRDCAEPQELGRRNWTLFGEINQKQIRPQDKPVPLSRFGRWEDLKRQLREIYGDIEFPM